MAQILFLKEDAFMRKLGISIYPEKSTKEELYSYIDKAAAAGFTRIFSCLLSVTEDKSIIKQNFIDINKYAKQKGFEIIVDVSPRVFQELGISYQDLTFFQEIKADGIRLDAGFSGSEEAVMTFNPQGLMIEINMSNDTHYIDTIMDHMPDPYHLIGCHNFYPHNYSGLSLAHFQACTKNFKRHGLRTAAFITSQAKNSFGPWPVTDGLPTLEMHRHLPLYLQLEHFITMGNIDDIIISNCFPTDEELESLTGLRLDMTTFHVELIQDLPQVETDILFEELHFNRGDISENFLRSTQSRVKYKGYHFALLHTPDMIRRGDVVIESSEYGHYAGELQIAKSDMRNSGKSNVVGHILESEHFLLDMIRPWQKFCFKESKK